MFLFKSEATEPLFSIPQKHIPTSSYIESQKSHDRQKKTVGGISILPNPPKNPPEPHLTTFKDGCYSFASSAQLILVQPARPLLPELR